MKGFLFLDAEQLIVASIPVVILMIENDEDRQLIIDIYYEYREFMYKVASKYFGSNNFSDIEDAVSTAVENMCRYVEKLRPEVCNNHRAYVLSIIGNACRRHASTANRMDALKEYSVTQEVLESIPDEDDAFQSVFDYSDALALLNSFSALSEYDKEYIRMYHIDRMSYKEIAARVKKTEGTVRVAVMRARKRLQQLAVKRRDELL